MKKINFRKIYEYVRDPKNKPVLFFGFYFIFFLVLAILFRMSPNTTNIKTTNKTPKSEHYYNLGKIEDANYHFKYDYNVNNGLTSFEGDRNGIRQLFTRKFGDTLNNFYGYRNLFMMENNNTWEKCDSPYVLSELFDVSVIREILDKATFMSKTEFQNKRYSYNYNISTTTLEKIINNNSIDLDDVPNEVSIMMDDNYYVYKIEYKLDSFYKYKDPMSNGFRLTAEFSDFGNIKEIEEVK